MTTAQDRRRCARQNVERPCKVLDYSSLRYIPGQTCNVSASGALLRIDSSREIKPGDRLDVAVSWGRDAVMASSAMIPASVVRIVSATARHQSVALSFERELNTALPAVA